MIIINLGENTARRERGTWHYVIANQSLLVDKQIGELSPFLYESQEVASQRPPGIADDGKVLSFREVDGWVARAWRQVLCYANRNSYRVAIEEMGLFIVAADGSSISFVDPSNGWADEETINEALLGPVLSVALAIQGTFLLHASALLVGDRVFAFLGDSGAGKSTLAAYLASENEGWQHLADDTLPIMAGADGPVVLPHFPQLKLPASEQVSSTIPECLHLGGIYLLDVPSDASFPSATPLDSRNAAATLIQHTIATSLFDDYLLAPHLDLCADIAARLPVQKLIYPHSEELLPDVAQLLAANIAEVF